MWGFTPTHPGDDSHKYLGVALQKSEEAGLHSESVGEEPKRRLRIYP